MKPSDCFKCASFTPISPAAERKPVSKSSLDRRSVTTGSRHRMVAPRGASLSSAVSPKQSPGSSWFTTFPPTSTSARPERTTWKPSAGSPSLKMSSFALYDALFVYDIRSTKSPYITRLPSRSACAASLSHSLTSPSSTSPRPIMPITRRMSPCEMKPLPSRSKTRKAFARTSVSSIAERGESLLVCSALRCISSGRCWMMAANTAARSCAVCFRKPRSRSSA
mmetsp:Transcript_100/g.211  ORF Transcript_100/g.211 Transcript_100/m.211 type:complete len:223 (-) Transcript_100:454-1122(-)